MKRETVMVVDDSADMLALQKMILEGDGFDVVTAQSGSAALVLLSCENEPTLIILDQELEDMSGLEFLEKLEAVRPETVERVPVVILSGAALAPSGRKVGYIQKFPDIDVFLERVHHFIEFGVTNLRPLH